MRGRLFTTLPLAVLVSAACANGQEGDSRMSVRDSAGVQIVENPGDLRVPGWTLSPEPTVSIGVLEGEPAYQLDQVRTALLQRDRIIVANSGSRELRYFDLDGRHVKTAGGRGGGPGEFQWISWMAPHGRDSIITYDMQNRRFSIFDLEGQFVRSFAPENTVFSVAGRFADGSFVVPPLVVFMTGGTRQGLVRDSAVIVRFSPDGTGADTLVRVVAGESMVDSRESGGRSMIMVRNRPFGLSTHIAVSDSLIFAGTGDAYQIAVYARDGRLVRLIRRDRPRARVGPAEIAALRERQLSRITDENRRRDEERWYAEAPYPDRMPAHGPLRVDDQGNLWVEEYSADRDAALRWTVFTAEGRAIGTTTTPARFSVHQIGSDFILGRWQDDDDVDHVVVYRLERSGSRELAAGAAR
ncbi:MAG TPA: 6-bladed beta-propeller [Gemmatimonadaceae bacterium]|nr:6-bladed beta-propeller [Gemmatimonadaceae bacterium]